MKRSERVAVHAVPVGVGSEAEGAGGLGAAAAATEKTAGVAGNLVAGDGDVLKRALFHGVDVGICGRTTDHTALVEGEGDGALAPPRRTLDGNGESDAHGLGVCSSTTRGASNGATTG